MSRSRRPERLEGCYGSARLPMTTQLMALMFSQPMAVHLMLTDVSFGDGPDRTSLLGTFYASSAVDSFTVSNKLKTTKKKEITCYQLD